MSPCRFRVVLIVWLLVGGTSCFRPSVARAQEEGAAVDATEVSVQATALPFPPDAREVEFEAAFGDIECKSGSSLGALEDFYRQEMKKRGWEEDASQAERDDESAKLAFEVGSAKVEIELDADSDGVISISLDCEGLDFDGTSDPTVLVAAGIPQPRTYAFLQKEIPRPEEVRDVEYSSNACHFKSPLALQAAFDFYLKELKGAGWREARRPIVTDDRRYTEFKKGAVTVSVNIFEHEGGSRIIVEYENPPKEKSGPRLPDVASDRPRKSVGDSDGDDEPGPQAAKVAVDVSANKGSATVTTGKDKFVFKHAAAYQNKDGGDQRTTVVFSDRPIPMQRLQTMLAKKADFEFGDLFEFDSPGQLRVDVGGNLGFMFNAGGVGIGNSLEAGDTDMKVEAGRVRGSIKMAEPKEVFDEPFLIAAEIDVVVLTPNTMIGGGGKPPQVEARQSPHPDSELLLPEGAENARSEGSQYTKSTQATVPLALSSVADFYRRELKNQGWQEEKSAGDKASRLTLNFKKPGGSMTVNLSGEAEETSVTVTSLDEAKAKQDGILPEAGKGRLVMVNAHTENVVVTIGKKNYTLKAGQGAEDPKAAWNYSLAPGKYDLTIKFPGKAPVMEKLDIGSGTTWGLFALPTGECLTNQLYGSAKPTR